MPVELPLKYRQLHPYAKKVGSKSNQSGPTGGKKGKMTQGAGLQIQAQVKKTAQQQTKDNQTIMILTAKGKIKFVKVKDLPK
jgi:hypothetical protein